MKEQTIKIMKKFISLTLLATVLFFAAVPIGKTKNQSSCEYMTCKKMNRSRLAHPQKN